MARLTTMSLALLAIVGAATPAAAPAASAASARTEVVAAAYPLAWAAHQVGGRRVAVQNLTPAGAEPHDLELSTAQRDAVEDADVVLVLGEGFQPAVEAAASRRDGITVAVLERLRLGAAHDPHVWLDPRLMIDIVDEVADALRTAHPGARAAFARRAAATNDTLAALDRRYRDGLADCRQDTIVTSHEAFGHLAEAYGLRQEGVAGIAPDAEPDPRRLGELADLVRERGITTVFTEELVSPRIAQTLAREAGGVQTAVLNPLEGLTARELRAHDDYVSVMDANLVTLRTALECA